MNLQHAIRLLQEACAFHHTAISTEKTYLNCLRHYACFLQRPQPRPLLTAEAKIQAFLTQLALRGVSASTQNQAFSALLFFYRYALKQQLGNVAALRAKRPAALRYCPDRTETLQLLAHVGDIHGYPTRLLTHLIYAAGLRVCEPLNLRIKDLDLKGRRLHIHQAKGNKGRVVQFPECLAASLERSHRHRYRRYRLVHHAPDVTPRPPLKLNYEHLTTLPGAHSPERGPPGPQQGGQDTAWNNFNARRTVNLPRSISASSDSWLEADKNVPLRILNPKLKAVGAS